MHLLLSYGWAAPCYFHRASQYCFLRCYSRPFHPTPLRQRRAPSSAGYPSSFSPATYGSARKAYCSGGASVSSSQVPTIVLRTIHGPR